MGSCSQPGGSPRARPGLPASPGSLCLSGAAWTARGAPSRTRAGAAHTPAQPPRDWADGRNGSGPARALRLPDGASAAWYILAIIGIYAVVFLFRLASNILRRNDKPLEDFYHLSLTPELKNRGPPGGTAKRSALAVSSTAALRPPEAGPGPHTDI